MGGPDGTEARGERDWRFDPEDFDDDGPIREHLEPGSPQMENIIFVIIGILIAVFIILRGIGLL